MPKRALPLQALSDWLALQFSMQGVHSNHDSASSGTPENCLARAISLGWLASRHRG